MIISVQNQKGGVGKTATAVSLAAVAREAGHRVLLVDLDPQASASRWLEVETDGADIRGISDLLDGYAHGHVSLSDATSTPRPETARLPPLDLYAADEALLFVEQQLGRKGITNQLQRTLKDARAHYDLIVIDGGPAITALSANAIYAADVVLAPVTLSSFALDGVGRLQQLLILARQEGHSLRALFLPTAADSRLRETNELLETLHEVFGQFPTGDVLQPIRYSSALSRAYGTRQTIVEYAATAMEEKRRPDPAAERALHDFGQLVNAFESLMAPRDSVNAA